MVIDVKSIFSSDFNLKESTNEESMWINATVGSKKDDFGSDFQFFFCTFTWLEKQLSISGYAALEKVIVVDKIDYDTVHFALNALCKKVSKTGDGVEKSLKKISMHGMWEYDSYEA